MLVVAVFAVQDPLFLAKFSFLLPSVGPDVSATPLLVQAPSTPWGTTGLSYVCGGGGPGVLQLTNSGHAAVNVTGISLTYVGSTLNATGPLCTLDPGDSLISITSLEGPAPPAATPFNGTVTLDHGTEVSFSGVWT